VAALRNHVFRLRKDLGGDVLVTKPWGYVLRTGPEDIDLQRFERLHASSGWTRISSSAAVLSSSTSWRRWSGSTRCGNGCAAN